MVKSHSLDTLEEYLASHRIKDFQYTTGLFQNGITIYKQQIRALNLFYALIKTNQLTAGSSICIVGGGVAGLTFAAAALKAQVNVLLLEKELIFLPLQHGCDTRQVHPYLYSWPNKGSLFPFTRLPVLPWKAGTAANVAKQIFHSFLEILKNDKKNLFKGYVGVRVDQQRPLFKETNSGIGRFSIRASGKLFKFESPNEKNNQAKAEIEFADIIIYCTGFGIEVEDKVTPSYWRNDEYGQMVVNDKNSFHLSGLGDGALTDLFRLKILGFTYEFFLGLHKSLPLEPERTKALIELKKYFLENPEIEPRECHMKFDSIKSLLVPLIESLKDHRRTNIDVTLAAYKKGTPILEFDQLIDLKKVSFINALIFYILTTSNTDVDNSSDFLWYRFLPGETKKTTQKGREIHVVETVDYNGKKKQIKIPKSANLILRHGTNRSEAFEATRISNAELQRLEKKQRSSKVFNSDLQLWTYDDLTALFPSPDERFFCTNETLTLCSTFASILSRAIDSVSSFEDGDFKLCLFRVVNPGNGLCLQSITPYFGSGESNGSFGKLFPCDKGPLGMAVSLQEPVLFEKNQEELSILLTHLRISENDIFSSSESVLVIPILGKLSSGDIATNLVLCVDSKLNKFFNDENVLNTIISVTDGWMETIEKFIGDKILMDDLLFSPLIQLNETHKAGYHKAKKLNSYVSNEVTRTTLETLKIDANPLIFNEFYSFDIFHSIVH